MTPTPTTFEDDRGGIGRVPTEYPVLDGGNGYVWAVFFTPTFTSGTLTTSFPWRTFSPQTDYRWEVV